MAAAITGEVPAGTAAPAGASGRVRLAKLVGEPSWQAALLTLAPLLFLPEDASQARALLHASGAAILFCLLDTLVAAIVLPKEPAVGRSGTRLALVAIGALAAAATLVVLLGRGLPVLAFVFLPLLAAHRFWVERSWPLAAILSALAAACRVEAGALATGLTDHGWLLLTVAAAGAFHAVAVSRLRLAARLAPMRATAASRAARARDLLLLLLLGLWVGTSLALLGGEARLAAMGATLALLPAPFVLLGALRCLRIAMTGRDPRQLGLGDAALATAAAGWAASLLLGPLLAALP